jgi:hypothetical protein
MELDVDIVRHAVVRNHGGMTNCTDEQIMDIWNSLAPETREAYLAEEHWADDRTGPESDRGILPPS